MTAWLRAAGSEVNRKRVRRLLRLMGLETPYPQPRLRRSSTAAVVYPYLLKEVVIARVNQVWSTDITYIRLWQGFIYLMAIMDWYRRDVLAWEVSTSLESSFCVAALDRALQLAPPENFNSDQGSQLTSRSFTQKLLEREVKISIDGRGRVFDSIFVERLWRSVKYEEVYLKDYRNMREAIDGLHGYFEFYNRERLYQSLAYQTPEAVYRQATNYAAATTLN